MSKRFRFIDRLYLVLAILPLLVGIVLKILFTPASEGISVTGALVYWTYGNGLLQFQLTESMVNSWIVLVFVFWLCRYITHGITAKGGLKRQILAEWIVEQCDGLIKQNMGPYFKGFAPFIAAMMGLSAFSSLLALLGLYPPTSDLNVVGGWAILVFILITHFKMKCGPLHYLKSFGDPVPFLAPLNIISEVATPISMAFRHYGNVLSGSVISTMLAVLLAKLSKMLLGWLPGILADFPLLRIGIPAVFSIYFDLFSGLLQAFIFAMLTMLYVAGGFPEDLFKKKKAAKAAKKCQQ